MNLPHSAHMRNTPKSPNNINNASDAPLSTKLAKSVKKTDSAQHNQEVIQKLQVQLSETNQVTEFKSFDLHPTLLDKLNQQGIHQPTAIQAQTIPLLMEGHDMLASSKTGSGKTLAFSLPLLHSLLEKTDSASPLSPNKRPVRMLVLVPTRELADQVHDAIFQLVKGTSLRLGCLQGGMSMRAQKATLLKGCDIIVATVGRLLDHLRQKTMQLNKLQTLVLDEADRMLDMGFLPSLDELLKFLPTVRQTLMFSATFSPAIEKIAKKYLHNPQKIEANQSNQVNENINQIIYAVKSQQKNDALLEMIRQQYMLNYEKAPEERNFQLIVFANAKSDCNRIEQFLKSYDLDVQALHGDIAQSQRQKIMQAFKKQQLDILVATDVAARGLDIPNLPLVINYNLPFHAEDYIHRIGRTGRAGALGKAISLYTARDAFVLKAIAKLIKQKLEPKIFNVEKSKLSEGGSAMPAHEENFDPSVDDETETAYKPTIKRRRQRKAR